MDNVQDSHDDGRHHRRTVEYDDPGISGDDCRYDPETEKNMKLVRILLFKNPTKISNKTYSAIHFDVVLSIQLKIRQNIS